MKSKDDQMTGWTGWIAFGGFLMLLGGIFQVILGLVALLSNSYLAIANTQTQLLVVHNIDNWGWAHLIVGSIVALAGISLFSGTMWSRIIAVIVAMASATANIASISMYPIWNTIMIALAVFVMYAVIVHGSEMKMRE